MFSVKVLTSPAQETELCAPAKLEKNYPQLHRHRRLILALLRNWGKEGKQDFICFFFSKNWPFQPFIQYFWQSRFVSFLTSSLSEICIKSKRINFLCTVILKPNFDSATNPIFTLHGPYEHANPKFTLQEQAERDFLLNFSWFRGFIENLRARGTVLA